MWGGWGLLGALVWDLRALVGGLRAHWYLGRDLRSLVGGLVSLVEGQVPLVEGLVHLKWGLEPLVLALVKALVLGLVLALVLTLARPRAPPPPRPVSGPGAREGLVLHARMLVLVLLKHVLLVLLVL